jgi:hypothetical protein
VWTAKRILILMAGVVTCLVAFTVYATFLGGIDGVEPLPIGKLPQPQGPDDPAPEPETDRRLGIAFGAGCKELNWPLKLFVPEKDVAFAAGECTVEKSDGRVRLAPFSAAFFHKSKTPGAYPEISTIRADIAWLTLDRPVSSFTEIGNRKVIGVEMRGNQPGITLTNNRGTAEKSDDVDILIINGPLYYEERLDLISTNGVVCLTDHQSKPPMVITGHKLKMQLSKDTSPNRPKNPNAKPANDTSGIERIELESDVDMRFWVDSRSGFLGGGPNAKKPPQPTTTPGKAPEKAQIHIRTTGPFVYDLTRETAWFERGTRLDVPDQVSVERIQKINQGEKIDQLTCGKLDLQFRRVSKPSPEAQQGPGGDKEIETAHATRRDVNLVVLALVSEGMDAFGNEMFYRAGDAVNGPMTILKGEPNRPLRTVKDGHRMWCQEMHLFGANRAGEGQRAWAAGPGQIDLLDAKDPNKASFPTHIRFREFLSVVKDKEGGKLFDLITVKGEASFVDDLQNQELYGQELQVWMEQLGNDDETRSEVSGSSRQEIRRLLAVDRVRAFSPEYIIRKTNRLHVTFNPVFARNEQLPTTLPEPVKEPEGGKPGVVIEEKGKVPPTFADDKKPAAQEKKPADDKKAPPIELEGNKITVVVNTLGQEKKLQSLFAEGNVYVFQPGDKPGEKRLDITGSLLTIRGPENARTLIVHGEKDKAAQLEVGDTIIWGPVVTVNQADNKAEVDGLGAMDMPSNKNLDGSQSTKKNTRIRIDWKKNMTFDGMYATFRGGVQAREHGAQSRALCEELTAKLDKHISFKDGQNAPPRDGQKSDKENAKIDRLIFSKNVFVEKYEFDEQKRPLQYQMGQGTQIINRDEGPTNVTGPGWVKLLAMSGADQGFGPATSEQKNAKRIWKLTHVRFSQSMDSVTRPDGKKTTFYGLNGGVEVFHFPTVKIEDTMDPDHPKKDGLYLRCDVLTIDGRDDNNRTTQTMIARTNVFFRTEQNVGYCDILKYDEANDIVIMEGLNGNPVRLYKMENGRQVPQSIRSDKVLYNRKTGQIDTEGVKSIGN